MASARSSRICPKGHHYYKSTDCPVCPVCEKLRKPVNGFLSSLSAPARRALQEKGITTAKQLSRYREKEILSLHGIGPSSLPRLKEALQAAGLGFKP